MRAYLAIKYHADNSNRTAIEQISAQLTAAGIASVCITRDVEHWGEMYFSPEGLMRLSFAKIEQSELIIVDLTEKGVGLGIETGYAHARGIPIITIARQGADISETLRGISTEVFCYASYADLRPFFKRVNEKAKKREGEKAIE
ncbi:MAG TPA: nucleoside 2-deoxyribosyltransferase [Thermoflexia bacterium]|nr:nucleoside 2-deoxyribosyltransferase [Thermoflexia bacterium]